MACYGIVTGRTNNIWRGATMGKNGTQLGSKSLLCLKNFPSKNDFNALK